MRITHQRFCALVAAMLLWPLTALGQDPPDDEPVELPETTVTAPQEADLPAEPFPAAPLPDDTVLTPQRNETPISEVGDTVTVIPREEIVRSRETQVTELLRRVPGLDVVQSGPVGTATSVFLRGAESFHTKVLLDGIPLNDASNPTGAFDFSTLTVDNIERIEVLRGPQSTLYGSNAIGGVVNIITRRGEGPLTAQARLMGGSYGTSDQRVTVAGGTDTYYYSFGAQYFDNEGFSLLAIGTEDDGYQNSTLSGRYGWTPTEDFDVDYVFRYIDAIAEIDGFDLFFNPFDDPIRANLSELFYQRVQLRYAPLDGLIENKIGFNLAKSDRFDTNPGFADAAFEGDTDGFDYQTNLLLTEANTFTVGYDFEEEHASSSSVSEVSQDKSGVYVQDHVGIGERWFNTVGCRWEDHSAAGPSETYRVSSIYHIYESGTAFHASLGSGFRAPSLPERLFSAPFNNPDLLPEETKGWDYGIDQQVTDSLQVGVTYFRNDFTNLIQFNPEFVFGNPNGPPAIINIGEATAHGVEVTGLYEWDCCTDLVANYTRTDTEDETNGGPLARRPRNKANLGIVRRFLCDRARVGVNALFVGERLDSRFSGITLDDYVTVNGNGSYMWTDSCELFFRFDNLFDEEYQQAAGFNTAGLSAYTGVNLTW